MAGNKVYNDNLEKESGINTSLSINISNLISGIYVLALRNDNSYNQTKKIFFNK